jgi:hypothetical protein
MYTRQGCACKLALKVPIFWPVLDLREALLDLLLMELWRI